MAISPVGKIFLPGGPTPFSLKDFALLQTARLCSFPPAKRPKAPPLSFLLLPAFSIPRLFFLRAI